MNRPKLSIGQVVRHLKFGYRGVIYDIDLSFGLTEEWYEQVARSRPPKDQPWYRVLVSAENAETYVAERHLEPDESGAPIEHPQLQRYFDGMRDGYYYRDRDAS